MEFVYIILALIAGTCAPTQAGINSRLSMETNSHVLAALISFSVGTIALWIYSTMLRISLARVACALRTSVVDLDRWSPWGILCCRNHISRSQVGSNDAHGILDSRPDDSVTISRSLRTSWLSVTRHFTLEIRRSRSHCGRSGDHTRDLIDGGVRRMLSRKLFIVRWRNDAHAMRVCREKGDQERIQFR